MALRGARLPAGGYRPRRGALTLLRLRCHGVSGLVLSGTACLHAGARKFTEFSEAFSFRKKMDPARWCANSLDSRGVWGDSIVMTFQSFSPIQMSGTQTQVAFHRTELAIILSLYGRMVAAGEWRDYGISCLRDLAVFSIFRRTAENPLYRIEKRPKLRARQGQYAVVGIDGQILKRGNDLKAVLRVLERKLIRAVD